jgi:peptide deformylase
MRLTKKTLYDQAQPVDFTNPVKNQCLADQMLSFMQKKQGIGLAATQIGHSVRLFVMSINGKSWCCFNPEITEHSQETVGFSEGCLSFMKDQCTITRPQWIRVAYQDHSGKWCRELLTGIEARCFQHELDHLDGITMWHRYEEQNAEQSGN